MSESKVDFERIEKLIALAGKLKTNKGQFANIASELELAMLPDTTSPTTIEQQTEKPEKSPPRGVDFQRIRSHAKRLEADLDVVKRQIDTLTELRGGINDLLDSVEELKK